MVIVVSETTIFRFPSFVLILIVTNKAIKMSIYHKIYVQVFDQKGKRVDEISPNKLFIGLDVLREKWSA